jgi:signal transduction histidine kinase
VFILLLAVLAVSIIFARSMIGPLRKLRADALDVASHRLPDVVRRLSESEGGSGDGEKITIEPIGIDSTDEIGEVARAFDQVHSEAVRLAGDEAMLRANLNAMFVNLSRRSQTLIERQLGIIDTLEQSEQDPDRLSSLFRLDHLATRMRRNSENLLVLAGHETPRKWSQPVPLVDVLRAAISEIEQYERISLNAQPGIVVSGRAASDVVHLVAEVVENATAFSPEETPVLLTAQQVSSGGVLLDITDNGLGIPEEELAYANWRLENPPVVDVAVSRRMGLFVVGRLASRHGIRVRLRRSSGGGVSALVWLPDAVAESDAPSFGMPRRRYGTDAFEVVGSPATARPTVPGPRWPLSRSQTRPVPREEPNELGWTAFSPQNTLPPQNITPPQNPAPPQNITPPQTPPPPQNPVSLPVRQPLASPSVQPQVAMPVPPEVPSNGTGPRLPIYDAVESDWFRRGGKPVGGGSEPAAGSATGAVTQPWTSPADDGFRAAQAAASPTAGDTTPAGLPRRIPNANLVPGSIGGQGGPGGQGAPGGQGGIADSGSGADAAGAEGQWPAPPAGRRAPEEARSRMAGLQRGSREGRAAAPPSYWTDEN